MKTLFRVIFVGLAFILLNAPVRAEQIVPLEVSVQASEANPRAVVFNGLFDLNPSQEILEVLRRGISLTFVLEVKITKKRWYWVDRTLCKKSEYIRLSYSPLSRQYRINLGGISQNFSDIEQAIDLMSSFRNWKVCDYREINPENHEVEARLYLNTSRLPRPFQVSLKKDSDWDMDSGWIDVKIISNGA